MGRSSERASGYGPLVDFGTDPDLELIADAVQGICDRFDDEYWAACDAEHRFPWEFYERLAEGGWVGIAIPEQYGGGGRGITEAALVILNRRSPPAAPA